MKTAATKITKCLDPSPAKNCNKRTHEESAARSLYTPNANRKESVIASGFERRLHECRLLSERESCVALTCKVDFQAHAALA
jgi:hypothetical protein